MSKAQAANLASGKASDAYTNNFTTQQQQSAQQQANAVNAASTVANQYATAADQKATSAQMAQTEGQNEYNRSWGNIGNTAGIIGSLLLSDENAKDAVKTENIEKKTAREYSNDLDKYLHKKTYKDLIFTGV